jgi:LysR family transcriptional regulator for metE and metH
VLCRPPRGLYDRRVDAEIRHLRLVTAIAACGSVTRAADTLHLTQSALSHQLRGLESRLGTPLFHRVGKRMLPTPAGTHLIETAQRVLELVDRTETSIKNGSANATVPLRLSTECYTVYHWLPALLASYRRLHPKVGVTIDVNATGDPLKALLDGRIDLAIVTSRVTDRRLCVEPLFTDEFNVIVSTSHRLATRAFVAPEDFAAEALILYTDPDDSHAYQRVLVPARVKPASVQKVPLTEAIVELVRAGLGVGILTTWMAEPYVRAGGIRALPLTKSRVKREWTAATIAGVSALPYMRDFIGLVRASAPQARRRTRPRLVRA